MLHIILPFTSDDSADLLDVYQVCQERYGDSISMLDQGFYLTLELGNDYQMDRGFLVDTDR